MQTETLETWRGRYRLFVEGVDLTAVEDIFWPAYRHTMTADIRQATGLDALEEELLRFLQAGVSAATVLSKLFGCSARHINGSRGWRKSSSGRGT